MTYRARNTVTAFAFAAAAFAGQAADNLAKPGLTSSKIQVGTGRVAISFNNGRRFFLSDETLITERGVPVDAEVLIQVGTGRRARFLVAGDVDDTITGGTLTSIEFGSQMKGPVTGTEPLTIFNYEVAVTSTTVLDDVPGGDIANLVLGDEVELAGFSDVDGEFQVTGLEYRDEPLQEWVIVGPVTAIDQEGFAIGPQSVAFNGIDPEDCEDNFAVGRYVKVEASPDPSFTLGSTITTTTDIECESEELGGDPGALVPAYVEGFVTSLGEGGSFTVGEQAVTVSATTEYEDGDATDVQVGVRVQVEGLLDTDTNVLDAAEVEFEQLRVEAEGPVSPGDVTANAITLFGIQMWATPLTEDEDNILAGIAGPIQVKVEGYVDGEGQVYLDDVEETGIADASDVSLRGGVESINRPEFTVLGVTIDASSSVLMLDDESAQVIDSDTFFAELAIGSEVEVEDAAYDELGNRISGGTIAVEVEDGDDGKSMRLAKGMNEFGVGIGVIVESGDAVFASGFE